MNIIPKYHFNFVEPEELLQSIGSEPASGSPINVTFFGDGILRHGVEIDGTGTNAPSVVVFNPEVGQFGTGDFTIAFRVRITSIHGRDDVNIISNRAEIGHGNWFSIRYVDKEKLAFEVDENDSNFAFVTTEHEIKDGKWHHVAAVRQGTSLKLYIDGKVRANGQSQTGTANINTQTDVMLGWSSVRTGPTARYDDLRIYDLALMQDEVMSLWTKPLNEGEVELRTDKNLKIIFSEDIYDLRDYSHEFNALRLGPNTGATLTSPNGVQKFFVDIPNISATQLGGSPTSLNVWPTVGAPFAGSWTILAPDDKMLIAPYSSTSLLTTVFIRTSEAFFRFHYNLYHNKLQLIPSSYSRQSGFFRLSSPSAQPTPLFVDDMRADKGTFSLVNASGTEWLKIEKPDPPDITTSSQFSWTTNHDERAIFLRAFHSASEEGKVGRLLPGEVALYEKKGYEGRNWVLSDKDPRLAMYFESFVLPGLDNTISSIRLGPDTFITGYRHRNAQNMELSTEEVVDAMLEHSWSNINDIEDVFSDLVERIQLEDFTDHVFDLTDTQVGDNQLSGIDITRTVPPETILSSYTAVMSEDYKMVNNELEEFSSYRTTLRFLPGNDWAEISATDLTTIEVEGVSYVIREDRPVTLRPNKMNQIMVTSEAHELSTPGLKIRTNTMQENQRVIIFPDQIVHQQLAELEDNAIWDGEDANGEKLVDREEYTQDEIANLQTGIKDLSANVSYSTEATVTQSRTRFGEKTVSIASTTRTIERPSTFQPIELRFGAEPVRDTNGKIIRRAGGEPRILHRFMTSEEFASRMQSAAKSGDVGDKIKNFFKEDVKNFFKDVGEDLKQGWSIAMDWLEDGLNFIIQIGQDFVVWIVDTVEQIVAFVEEILKQIINAIKKFIEFLRFLFDWGDMLETQKYLVDTINAALTYSIELAEEAQQSVSIIFGDLKNTIEDKMNDLIEDYGGDPNNVEEDDEEPSEALEWIFDKLFGGSGTSSGSSSSDSQSIVGDSAMATMLRRLVEGIGETGTMLQDLEEGIGEAIEALITNPSDPKEALVILLQTLKDFITQSIDVVEDFVMTLLEIFATVIAGIQDLLNAEINMPLLSKLFEKIGAGKLTALNLTALLVAIPLTIASKLATGEQPFSGLAPLDLSSDSQRISTSPSDIERQQKIWAGIGIAAGIIYGRLNAALDLISPATDTGNAAIDNILLAMEVGSLFSGYYIWLASFPASPEMNGKPAQPGGYPYRVHSYPVTATDSIYSYERQMWWIRTIMHFSDWAYIIVAQSRRVRRDGVMTGVAAVFGISDLMMTKLYIQSLDEGDTLKKAALMSSALPSTFSPIRYLPRKAGTAGRLIVCALDIVEMYSNVALRAKIIKDLKDN